MMNEITIADLIEITTNKKVGVLNVAPKGLKAVFPSMKLHIWIESREDFSAVITDANLRIKP